MKKTIVLTHLQMRSITGGDKELAVLEGSQHFCMVDGEVIGNLPCSNDEECKKALNDPKASCSF